MKLVRIQRLLFAIGTLLVLLLAGAHGTGAYSPSPAAPPNLTIDAKIYLPLVVSNSAALPLPRRSPTPTRTRTAAATATRTATLPPPTSAPTAAAMDTATATATRTATLPPPTFTPAIAATSTATASATATPTRTATPTATRTATLPPPTFTPTTAATSTATRTAPPPTATFTPTPIPAAATFYVSTTGNDANPGSFTAPFRTIQKAVSRSGPGDVISVRGGTYFEEVVFDHGGTSALPITLQNYPGETPIIDGSMDVTGWTQIAGTNIWQASFTHKQSVSTGYVTRDVDSVSTAPDGYDYSGNKRAYLYVDDVPDQYHWLKPVNILGSSPEYSITNIPAGSFATDVPPPPGGAPYAGKTNKIYVHLSDNSNPNNHRIRIPAYVHGIALVNESGRHVNYVTVSGLAVRLAENGVLVSTHYPDPENSFITLDNMDISLSNQRGIETYFCSHDIIIKNTHVHHTQEESIHLESDNSQVTDNLIEDTIAPWSLYGDMGVNVLGNNNLIAGNEIRRMRMTTNGHAGDGIYMEEWYNGDGSLGCHAESGQNNIIERNRLHDNEHGGLTVPGDDNSEIRNNLIYNNGQRGIQVEGGGSGGTPTSGQKIANNNHIYNNTVYGNGTGIEMDAQSAGTIVRNNIVFNNGSGIVNGGTSSNVDHNLLTEPLFVNPANGDFHLQASSPAIQAGLNLSSAGVTVDFDRRQRPTGGAFDIGALEY